MAAGLVGAWLQAHCLSSGDAKKASLYRRLQDSDANASIKKELERLLAWSHAGAGILCDYLAFPMAASSDSFLLDLQNATFPRLTRFKNLDTGFDYNTTI